MIEIKGLTKSYGKNLAVENLDFSVNDGEVFGYLGPNGAGKTTTIHLLCGLIKPSGGTAFIEGIDVTKDSERIRKITGFLPDSPGLYDSLSLDQNLKFYAKLYGIDSSKYESLLNDYLKLMDLDGRRNEKVGTFSKGMRQKVAIIRSLLHDPKYLFFDEPTSGLDPVSAKTVRDFILKLKKENRVIFINTHNLDEAQRLCTRVAVLNKKILSIGKPGELEKTMFSQGTEIDVLQVTERIKSALKKQGFKASFSRKKISFQTKKPEKDNPEIVSAIVRAGGRIVSVRQKSKSLEDVYFKLIGGNNEHSKD